MRWPGTEADRAVNGTRAARKRERQLRAHERRSRRFASSKSSIRQSKGLRWQRQLRAHGACERRWCLKLAVVYARARTVVARLGVARPEKCCRGRWEEVCPSSGPEAERGAHDS